jgi:hypothetical protein
MKLLLISGVAVLTFLFASVDKLSTPVPQRRGSLGVQRADPQPAVKGLSKISLVILGTSPRMTVFWRRCSSQLRRRHESCVLPVLGAIWWIGG